MVIKAILDLYLKDRKGENCGELGFASNSYVQFSTDLPLLVRHCGCTEHSVN